jgi:predicted nucleotidyltransferase
MGTVQLHAGLADAAATAALARLIEVLETAFPGSITGCFLFGSRATAVPESDLDLVLVTAPDTRPGTRAELKETCVRHGRELGLPAIDLIVVDHETLLAKGHFRVKSCSVHLWGDDIRPAMPDLPFDAYLRTYKRAPVAYMTGVLRRTDRLFPPVSHPDTGDEFYGYSQPTLPPGNTPIPNVLALVATACWIASVLVSMRTGRTVASKAEAVSLYREHASEAWASYVAELYEFGNRALGYMVPTDPGDRQRLRQLCRRCLVSKTISWSSIATICSQSSPRTSATPNDWRSSG